MSAYGIFRRFRIFFKGVGLDFKFFVEAFEALIFSSASLSKDIKSSSACFGGGEISISSAGASPLLEATVTTLFLATKLFSPSLTTSATEGSDG